MRFSFFVFFVFFCLAYLPSIYACEYLKIHHRGHLGVVYFRQIPLDAPEFFTATGGGIGSGKTHHKQDTGRPFYVSIEHERAAGSELLFLYHISNINVGEGKWIISRELNLNDEDDSISNSRSSSMIGYIRSWAILPYYYESVLDNPSNSNWYFINPETNGFESHPDFTIECFNDIDKTVFIQMESTISPRIDGYYVERFLSSSDSSSTALRKSVYTQIKFHRSDNQLYLFRLPNVDDPFASKWLIGFQYGIDSAYAFCEDPSEYAMMISNPWNLLESYDWRVEETLQILSTWKFTQNEDFLPSHIKPSLPEIIRYIRSEVHFSSIERQKMYELRNNVLIPMIGLGTGGIYLEESEKVFRQAIAVGYQLFDLAREYGNEFIMGNVLRSIQAEHTRDLFFLETKVWPTQLGFLPTSNAIIDSLNDLQTSYIDLYLLHWPE